MGSKHPVFIIVISVLNQNFLNYHLLVCIICFKIINLGNRCVLKMDHHCPWLNTCVGHANHPSFMIFIFTSIIASIQSSTLLLRILLLVLA